MNEETEISDAVNDPLRVKDPVEADRDRRRYADVLVATTDGDASVPTVEMTAAGRRPPIAGAIRLAANNSGAVRRAANSSGVGRDTTAPMKTRRREKNRNSNDGDLPRPQSRNGAQSRPR